LGGASCGTTWHYLALRVAPCLADPSLYRRLCILYE
jgi:hypothetical protein